MTEADVMSYSLTLAGKLARGTAEYSVEQIATEITEVARV